MVHQYIHRHNIVVVACMYAINTQTDNTLLRRLTPVNWNYCCCSVVALNPGYCCLLPAVFISNLYSFSQIRAHTTNISPMNSKHFSTDTLCESTAVVTEEYESCSKPCPVVRTKQTIYQIKIIFSVCRHRKIWNEKKFVSYWDNRQTYSTLNLCLSYFFTYFPFFPSQSHCTHFLLSFHLT